MTIIKILQFNIAVLLIMIVISSSAWAELASMNEAFDIAEYWMGQIIHTRGHWGDSQTADIENIQEFKRADRVIGYFCQVKPQGYIIVSLHKELAPVKAYSDNSNMDPKSEEGLADVIKAGMEGVLNAVQIDVKSLEKASSQEIQSFLEINYRPVWERYQQNIAILKAGPQLSDIDSNYNGGAPSLVSSSWHQSEPYNDQCPDKGCAWPCNSNNNALVGCVATAGAQIIRYWDWPPVESYGYDWLNMPDSFSSCTWNQSQVNAVAELCHDVGVAVGMSYGCDESSAYTYEMAGVYGYSFGYHIPEVQNRDDYTTISWYEVMKSEFQQNRPVHYRVNGHSLLADGWRESGDPVVREYHMNYGWDDSNTAWYTLDAHPLYDVGEDYLLRYIYPAPSLHGTVSGDYSPISSPYRYFDQDATGDSAVFYQGHKIQFLPGVKVTCTSTTGGYIRFIGRNTLSSYNTYFFTRGDTSTGVKIINGAIRLYQNGSIRVD